MSKKAKVNFLHIGKTGGSAIRSSFEKYSNKGKYSLVFNRHSYFLTDVPKGEKIVFFIRDPISRFISGFYSRKRKGRPLYNVPWKDGEEEAFNLFETPNLISKCIVKQE